MPISNDILDPTAKGDLLFLRAHAGKTRPAESFEVHPRDWISSFYEGTEGDDTIVGNAGETNEIYGYGGDDRLVGSNYSDPTIPFPGVGGEGGNGDFIVGGAGNDTVIGAGGDDFLYGCDFDLVNGGNNLIKGGAGNDFLRGGDGIDTIVGGAGFDRISYYGNVAAYTSGVDIDLRTQTVYDDGFGNQDVISGIESVSAGTLFADRLLGDDGANYLGAAARTTPSWASAETTNFRAAARSASSTAATVSTSS